MSLLPCNQLMEGSPSDTVARPSAAHASLGEKGKKFVNWMIAHNFDIHPSVQLRYVDSYQAHSVFCVGPLDDDCKLFQIPKSMVLNWKNSSLRKSYPSLKLPGWNRLIMAMMFELCLGDESTWKPYLDILPEELNTLQFWSSDERKMLTGTMLDGHKGSKTILKQYDRYIVPLLSNKNVYPSGTHSIQEARHLFYSFAQYRRLGSLIMAYSFCDAYGEEVNMVPMADMLNHRTDGNNARLFFDRDDTAIDTLVSIRPIAAQEPPTKKRKLEQPYLHMRTIRPVQAGEELFNTYGCLPDSELLRKYGYTDDIGRNRWNDIEIPVRFIIDSCSKNCGWNSKDINSRIAFIFKNQLIDLDAALTFHLNQASFGPNLPLEQEEAVIGGISKDLIAICKIFAANEEEWNLAQGKILERTKPRVEQSVRTASSSTPHPTVTHDADLNEDNTDEESLSVSSDSPSGGDLIPVADRAKLRMIISGVLQEYRASICDISYNDLLQKLGQLPIPGSASATSATMRQRFALILKAGSCKLLDELLEDVGSIN